MKVSVYTPSHQPTYLNECYESLRLQTHEDWEWVVLLNQQAQWECPTDDPRVIVTRCTCRGERCMYVGALKREAISHTTGPILVELDHDDMLTPRALELVANTFALNPDVGFSYSQFSQIDENGEPNTDRFDSAYGWEYRQWGYYQVPNNMPAYPSDVANIHYAPNHLRAFRRTLYDHVGGYDPMLEVCDDLDLMCRMYQACGSFHELRACLYLQRVHGGMTQKNPALNAKIQNENRRLYDLHLEPNALAWAHSKNLRCLDMGGAHNSPGGYTIVDKVFGEDAIDYLSHLFPSSVGVIRCFDFLEHLPQSDVVEFINRCHLALAPGGVLLTRTPSTDGRGAFQDPTHVSYWNENSWWYYTDREYAKYIPAYMGRFIASRVVSYFPNDFCLQNSIPYVDAYLVCVKDDAPRPGGLLKI